MNVTPTMLISFFLASFLGAFALQGADLGHIPWAVSRASGLVAFAVLSASVIMGLLISTKASDGLLSRPFVFDMHQFLSVASLVLIGVHAGSLLFDGFLGFTSLGVLVPFVSPYRPVAISVGIIAAWLCAITTASFWMRARIGQKRWRTLHYATFLAYAGGLWHGLAAGTDTQLPLVYWGYILSLAVVTALTVLRVSGYKKVTRRASPTRPTRAAPSQARA